MAYPCRIWLKNECDGCGACEDPDCYNMSFNRGRPPVFGFDEDYNNPFDYEED